MSYLMYLRKSRADKEAEARGEGETLARHEQILSELAAKMDLPIGATYKEIVSGETISSRPKMQQLLIEVMQGHWEGVLVMEIDVLPVAIPKTRVLLQKPSNSATRRSSRQLKLMIP